MDIKHTRKTNLRALVAHEGTIAELHHKTGAGESYISQILTGVKSRSGTPRGLGDKVARKIEVALGLPHGWMDTRHHSDAPAADSHEYALDYDVLEEIFDYIEIYRQHRGDDSLDAHEMAAITVDVYPKLKATKEQTRKDRKARDQYIFDQAVADRHALSSPEPVSNPTTSRSTS